MRWIRHRHNGFPKTCNCRLTIFRFGPFEFIFSSNHRDRTRAIAPGHLRDGDKRNINCSRPHYAILLAAICGWASRPTAACLIHGKFSVRFAGKTVSLSNVVIMIRIRIRFLLECRGPTVPRVARRVSTALTLDVPGFLRTQRADRSWQAPAGVEDPADRKRCVAQTRSDLQGPALVSQPYEPNPCRPHLAPCWGTDPSALL
ncbi:hypothetical protein B0I37DRAFT_387516 [Chaetomium sp. MPI-CAGE-AT-0009]|nr:hypothetical protein B0I37DRAFT_387516 [Chaetomium sp. MPI-CAGE-AT-0009]